MNERTVQHFPHSRKYKICISRAMHIDFVWQSNVTLFVFDVPHIMSPDSFGTWPAILLLEHEFRKRKAPHFVISFCLLEHTASVVTLFILILCYIMLFNLLRHRLLSLLFKHFMKMRVPNSKKTLLYECFFLFLHTIFLRVFRKT
jgi:hypothetical protein